MTPTPPARTGWRLRTGLWSWLLAGVVVAVLGTVILVKVVGGSTGVPVVSTLSAASPAIRAEVTGIPASVFDAVGVRSGIVPVVAPVVLTDPAPSAKPFVLFVGTEYCAFCAAERWPLLAALSRFGTFGTLYDVASTPLDYAPDTPTFSFYGTSYRSHHVAFHAYELASDVLGAHGYLPLMHLSSSAKAAFRRYDPAGIYPFVDVDNEILVLQANLSPETFAQTTRDQIAAGLDDPTNPVTRGIVAAANYLSAAICHADGQRPASVCTSPGVSAADAALGLAS